MKLSLLAIALFALPVIADNNPSPSPDIIGTWVGKDLDQSPVTLTFHEDGTATSNADGEISKGIYRLDPSKKPMILIIAITENGETETVHTIIEFTDPDKIRMEDNDPGNPTPTKFTDKAMTFTRKK